VLVLAIPGCKSREPKQDAPKPDAAIVAKPTVVADAAPAPVTTTVVCDRLFPAALLASHYPGMKMHETFAPDYPGVLCELAGTAAFGNAGFLCSDPAMFPSMMDYSRGQLEGVKDLAVGKRAFVGTIGGISTLALWDEDAGCTATINGFTGDPTALATALETALTAEVGDVLRAHGGTVPPAPVDAAAGKTDVCDRLLPAAVRSTYFGGMTMTEMVGMGGVSCSFAEGYRFGGLQVYCPVDTPDSKKYTVDLARMNTDAVVDVPGNPNAFTGTALGTPIVFAWDDDGRCGLTATGYAGDSAAFATAMQGALTAEIGDRLRATLP
jgi:hypothetical protein